MIKRDACFYCTTPYQIMCAIAITKSGGKIADIYIEPRFELGDLDKRLKQLRIFAEVHVVDVKIWNRFRAGFCLMRWARMLQGYMRLSDTAQSILLADIAYDDFFYSFPSYQTSILSVYLSKMGTNINCCDDGQGSYTCENWHVYPIKERVFRKIFFNADTRNRDEQWWLYLPEFYRMINSPDIRPIQKIENIWNRSEIQKDMIFLFGMTEDKAIRDDVILLDIVWDETLDERGEEQLRNVYNIIFAAFGKEHVLIKKHPRNKKMPYIGCRYNDSTIPFEILVMGQDVNKKILISLCSTATATFKLMQDEEPYILLLYKVVSGFTAEYSNMDNYFRGLQALYRVSEKVMIPNNIGELKQCLKLLKGKVSHL